MHSHTDPQPAATTAPSTPKRPALRWAIWGFFAIAAYFLWTEHRAHLLSGLSWLPYLVIMACPLLHVFMHRGHGGRGGHGRHDNSASTDAANTRGEG